MDGKEFRLKIRLLENLRENARRDGSKDLVKLYTKIIEAHKADYFGQFEYSLTEKARKFQEQRHGRGSYPTDR